jgi:hypothetical protein
VAKESPAADHLTFETPVARLGREGLNLAKSLDDLTMQEVSRLSNLYHQGGDLYTRPGQALMTSLAGTVHSARRLNDPLTGTYTRFWGGGGNWYRGASGALGVFAGGFSGNPLTMIPVRPQLSGQSWMVAADSNQMMKATASSPPIPLGLPAPASCTTAIASPLTFPICQFDSSDGTETSQWQVFTGTNLEGLYLQTPASALQNDQVLAYGDVPGVVGNAVHIQLLAETEIAECLMVGISLPFFSPRNYTLFTGGVTITDDDVFHFNLKLDTPTTVSEIRIYFTTSPFVQPVPFNNQAQPAPGGSFPEPAWSLPGMGFGAFTASAYMGVIRPNDYTNALAALETLQSAADRVRTAAFLEQYADPVAAAQAAEPNAEAAAGVGIWSTLGEIGYPVITRGDFISIGGAGSGPVGTNDWNHITGMYVVIMGVPGGTPDVPQFLSAAFDNCYFVGGSGPDNSSGTGGQKYDYRVINYDPRSGARSNGSPIQTGAPGALNPSTGVVLTSNLNVPDLTLDALRQPITITPSAYSDPNVLQEAYRRGGSLNDNWYYVGVNTANGGVITDTFADTDILNADTIPLQNFQPIATVNAAGTVILAQPLPIIFGPLDDGTVCGLGDPYQPGFLYASLPGEIDHWPSTGGFAIEVCAPGEQLMNGCVYGGQGFVLSRERGYLIYSNLTGSPGIVSTSSTCTPGLAARWGFVAHKSGIFYVARDGVRVTQGGDSTLVSEQIRPVFHNQTVNGVAPINFAVPTAIRLAIYDTDLYFLYQDTNAANQCLVYSLVYHYWRTYQFAQPLAFLYADETDDEQFGQAQGALLAILGSTNGNAYTFSGYTDAGTAIPFEVRTGAWNWGRPREEKNLGDLIVEADLEGATLTATTYLNTESVQNLAQTVAGSIGRTRYLFDFSGTTPQHARNVSIDLSGSAPLAAQAFFSFVGIGYSVLPEVTMNRATTWEPLSPTEGYLYGVCLDCDTGGAALSILVEYDLAGVVGVAATLTVTSSGRHKQWFSWPAVHAQLVRLRPANSCGPWLLYNAEWISQPEPPRIAGWDTNFEDLGDSYYTGMDLELNTFGLAKTLHISVDSVEIPGSPFTLNTATRLHRHLTFTPGRGHIYRAWATDANPGLLYTHKWITDPEPLEQSNWNAPYTVWNSLSDKLLKGVILEVDTYGVAKSVNIEVDQVVLQTITVQCSGRSVLNFTWVQVLGRVFRIIPTDANLSRLYSAQPLFDEEPFSLARWESQRYDFDLPGSGWGSLLNMDCCYRGTAAVTLTLSVYDALGRLLQTLIGVDLATGVNALPTTAGVKQKRFVVFPANKGVLWKLVATTADGTGVTVYKEESRMRVQPWASGEILTKWLATNDDLMPTREMTKAAVAAGRQGGAAR